MSVTVYGRTYLDAEVTFPLATLAEGKGKVDTQVTPVLGGFGCNAARALATRLPRGQLHLVTVMSSLDHPRLRAEIPTSVSLDTIVTGEIAWPPISVIINPGGTCKLLRGAGDEDASHWRIARVNKPALASDLHIVGRLPAHVLGELARRLPRRARLAWVGGAALPRALEPAFHLMCVNTAEAQALLRSRSADPHQLAHDLAARARPDAVRLVTGRGAAPAVAAVQEARGHIRLHERAPAPVKKPRRFKGVGDAFAATFLVEACLDRKGQPRAELDVAAALAAAQKAAGKFLVS